MNIVRTWTEHNEHEHFVHVRVHHLLKPNLNVQVQVRAQDPRTRTEPNRGQSIINRYLILEDSAFNSYQWMMSDEPVDQYLEYCNAAIVQPLELVRLNYLDSGLFFDLPVYYDETTKKTLLKCDLCGTFTVLGKKRSIRRIYSHSSSTGCTRKQKRIESRDGELESGLEDCLPQHGRPFKFINFLRSLQYLVLASKFNTASSISNWSWCTDGAQWWCDGIPESGGKLMESAAGSWGSWSIGFLRCGPLE